MKLFLNALLAGLLGLAAVAQNEPNQPAQPAPVQPEVAPPADDDATPPADTPAPLPGAQPTTKAAAIPAPVQNPVVPAATNAAPSTTPRVPAIPRQFPRPLSTATNATAQPTAPPAFPTLPAPRPRAAGQPGGAAAVPAAGAVPEAEVTMSEDGTEIINLRNMPIEQFLGEYQGVAQRIVLRGQNLPLQGQINLSIPEGLTLTREERLQMYDTILALNGVTMIPTGTKAVLAVPSAQSLQEGAAFSDKSAKDYAEASQFVTHVVQLKFADMQEAVDTIKGFAKNPNGILGIPTTKTIVLRDYAINVKRMLEVLEKIDIEVDQDFVFEVIPIRYGKVEEVYATVSSVTGGGGGGGFIGSGTTGTTGRAGRFGTGSAMGGGGRFGSQSSRSSRNSRSGIYGGNQFNQQQLNQGGIQNQPGGQTFQGRLNQTARGAGGGGGAGSYLLGDLEITPDMRSNSLIVYGTKKDIAQLKKVLEKVDTLLAQVLIEGVIMDVTLSDGLDYGLSVGQRPASLGGGVVGGGGMNNGNNSLGAINGFLGGATNFAAADGLTYFSRLNKTWDATLTALAEDGKANIIQRPRILTSHAVPASFFVGSTVPFISGSYFGGSGIAGSQSYYDRQDVGIGLEVTPFITPDKLVVMEITQTIEELVGDPPTNANDPPPSTAKREATSQLSVRSGDAVLLGGFMRNDSRTSHSGVPFLKDIPVLGYLFKSHQSSKSRSELMVLIKPTVLSSPEEAAKLADAQRVDSPAIRELEKDFEQQDAALQKKVNRKTGKGGKGKSVTSDPPKEVVAPTPLRVGAP